MPATTIDRKARVEEAQLARMHALDAIDLGLAKGEMTGDEAAKWVELIFRCRSLDDIRKLKNIVSTRARC